MKIMEAAEKYTYAEYAAFGEANPNERYELIDGVIYLMSAAPSRAHQTTSIRLATQLSNFLKGKSCDVFHAPFDVCLNAKGDKDKTTVQPDILVVCDKNKLDDKRCNGAPDFIIEILSLSNKKHDLITKYNAYLKAGVREFWIIDPDEKIVFVYILENDKYICQTYDETSIISVHVLEGCTLDMNEVFEQ